MFFFLLSNQELSKTCEFHFLSHEDVTNYYWEFWGSLAPGMFAAAALNAEGRDAEKVCSGFHSMTSQNTGCISVGLFV